MTWGPLNISLASARLRATAARRPYWQVRYKNGRVISEWDLDWSLIPRKGLLEARMVCPNGQVAVLGHPIDASERLFQFKRAVLMAGVGRATTAYLLGIVTQPDGTCQCAVWEPDPGRLITFRDNANAMQYDHIGRVAASVLRPH